MFCFAGRGVHGLKTYVVVKGRSLAELTVHADAAAHEFNQARGNRETQTRAAEFSRGRSIGLGEGLEDPFLMGGVDANASVADLEVEANLPSGAVYGFDANDDLSALCKLQSIAHEIHDDLTQASCVATQRIGDFRGDVTSELQSFLVRTDSEELERMTQSLTQAERLLLQVHLAGLDFRKIQNIVDDLQKAVGGRLHDGQILALLFVQTGVQSKLGHTQNAIHRSTNFMTHVGKELALGAIGALGGFFRVKQSAFRAGLAILDDEHADA